MQKDRGFRALSIAAILVAVVALSVGYAALSQTLNINGTAKVKGSTWDVHFENLTTPSTMNGGLLGKAASTSATVNTTSFTFASELTLPGDAVIYKWDVTNSGTINAILDAAPVITGLSEAAAQHVNYEFTYADGNAINANDTLDAGETKHLMLTITFDSDATEVPTGDQTLTLSSTLTYVQS